MEKYKTYKENRDNREKEARKYEYLNSSSFSTSTSTSSSSISSSSPVVKKRSRPSDTTSPDLLPPKKRQLNAQPIKKTTLLTRPDPVPMVTSGRPVASTSTSTTIKTHFGAQSTIANEEADEVELLKERLATERAQMLRERDMAMARAERSTSFAAAQKQEAEWTRKERVRKSEAKQARTVAAAAKSKLSGGAGAGLIGGRKNLTPAETSARLVALGYGVKPPVNPVRPLSPIKAGVVTDHDSHMQLMGRVKPPSPTRPLARAVNPPPVVPPPHLVKPLAPTVPAKKTIAVTNKYPSYMIPPMYPPPAPVTGRALTQLEILNEMVAEDRARGMEQSQKDAVSRFLANQKEQSHKRAEKAERQRDEELRKLKK
jgi:hypothetical protein